MDTHVHLAHLEQLVAERGHHRWVVLARRGLRVPHLRAEAAAPPVLLAHVADVHLRLEAQVAELGLLRGEQRLVLRPVHVVAPQPRAQLAVHARQHRVGPEGTFRDGLAQVGQLHPRLGRAAGHVHAERLAVVARVVMLGRAQHVRVGPEHLLEHLHRVVEGRERDLVPRLRLARGVAVGLAHGVAHVALELRKRRGHLAHDRGVRVHVLRAPPAHERHPPVRVGGLVAREVQPQREQRQRLHEPRRVARADQRLAVRPVGRAPGGRPAAAAAPAAGGAQ